MRVSGVMDAKKPRLTPNQRRFVEEYAGDDGNAVQAYFRAFGRLTRDGKRRSYVAARKQASDLLTLPHIQAEIKAAQDAYAAKVRVSKLRVIRELAAIAFADTGDLFEPDPDNAGLPRPRPWGDVPTATRRAVQTVKVRRKRLKSDRDETTWEVEEIDFKFHPKGDALDKLCKRLGIYDDELKAVARELAELGRQVREGRRGQPPAGGDPA